jgi:membrane associated rhomboid family serine protease
MITYALIGITCLVSYMGFSSNKLIDQLIFYPYEIKQKNSYFTFITHGFIHTDGRHLFFNMFTLFFFGTYVESAFNQLFDNQLVYPFFYLSALVFASIPSFAKYKNNPQYRALGASGAVAAVLFATILLNPWILINFIPGFIYAIGYIVYSAYMNKQNNDNIGHDAHLWGAIFGFLFPLVLKPTLFSFFIRQLLNPNFNF